MGDEVRVCAQVVVEGVLWRGIFDCEKSRREYKQQAKVKVYFPATKRKSYNRARQAAIACCIACPVASRFSANGRLVLTCSEPTLVSNVRVPLLVINLPVYVSCLCNFMSGGIVSGH